MTNNGRIFQAGRAQSAGLTAALVAAALLTASPAARADQDCNWYAQTSAKQEQTNESRNCKFKGDGWTVDKTKLVAWCQSVPPDEWRKAVTDRENQLKTCGS